MLAALALGAACAEPGRDPRLFDNNDLELAVGNTDLDAMLVGDREAAEEAGARVLLGVAATAIDRTAHTVRLSTGEALAYDRLVLATGSRANVPTLDGVERHRIELHQG